MESAEPNPTWDPESHAETVETLSDLADEVRILVWGADWCPDCRAALPDFFAALDAAGFDLASVEKIEVDREKNGELTDEYDVTLIPTVVVERDGEELARFEESADLPAADALAVDLRDA